MTILKDPQNSALSDQVKLRFQNEPGGAETTHLGLGGLQRPVDDRPADAEGLRHRRAPGGDQRVRRAEEGEEMPIASGGRPARPAGTGLFALKPEIDAEVCKSPPQSCQTPVRFMLSVEVGGDGGRRPAGGGTGD
jgi:hypothetical protein